MHGLGNDFVVLDARARRARPDVERRRAIADRRLGVGCDQLIVLEPPTDRDGRRLHAHLQSRRRRGRRLRQCHALRRLGADGRAQDRPGHGADHLRPARIAEDRHRRQRPAGDLGRHGAGAARLARHPGAPSACDTNHLPVGAGPLQDPVGTSMGNPHATFFVDDARRRSRSPSSGRSSSTTAFFPERANIGVAQLRRARTGCGCASGSAAPA